MSLRLLVNATGVSSHHGSMGCATQLLRCRSSSSTWCPSAFIRATGRAGPSHTFSSSISSSSSSSWGTAAELLDSLANYEQRGVPAMTGPDAAAHYDPGRMQRLLSALGSPQQRYPVVHVAGSKGKGSVSTMVAAVLKAAGYKVGTYTSPHIFDLTERISTSAGGPIPRAELDALVRSNAAALQAALQQEQGSLTHFEVLTALALRHFADISAEVAVVEVGIGGVQDATNVFSPDGLAAAVITPLGMEHVEQLGGNMRSIAAAKAGIMKEGRPVVIAQQQEPEALQVLLDTAQQLGCPVVRAEQLVQVSGTGFELAAGDVVHAVKQRVEVAGLEEALTGGAAAGSSSSTSTSSTSSGHLQLVGPHQQGNAATAIATAACLLRQGFRISSEHVLQGLARAHLPGRFQVVPLQSGTSGAPSPAAGSRPGARYLIADGAHTAESAAALAATVRQVFPDQPVALVVAMAADKDHRGVLAALRAVQPKVAVFTSTAIAGSYQRTTPPGTLVAQWQAAAILDRGRFFRCRELIQAGLASAVEKAKLELRGAEGEGVILVAGSLHAAAEAIKAAQS